MGKIFFGVVLLVLGIAIGFGAHVLPANFEVEAQSDTLAASTGPDITVLGPSLV